MRTDPSGLECEVRGFLGGGAQGEVYEAVLAGNAIALKWYYPESATPPQRTALRTLIKKGPPNARFLWPMELVSSQALSGFGYVMLLREPRYKGIVAMMKRRIEPTFRALARAGRDLSYSYLELHAKGLCYRDISFGNVFFDPDTGDVLICDNDNVTIDKSAPGVVLGTPRFMAPEVVARGAPPSTQTDLYSLSVLLFYMFMMHHPLDGKKEAAIHALDFLAMNKLYGNDATFIFDPDDTTNEPVPGYHDNALVYWPIYPQFLRGLFIQSFTRGIKDPDHGRVRETQWWRAMAALEDSILYCSACGAENFYDSLAMGTGGTLNPCWSCQTQIMLPLRLRLGTDTPPYIVTLNHDSRLFPYHVDSARPYDFSKAVAEVTRHPSDPNIWGLKNLSSEKWLSITAEGTSNEVEPGRSVTLAVGTKIHFGKGDAEILV